MGRGGRGGGKKPPGREKLQFSVCDVSSDEFKKTWLMLKELHDKELHRLQAKLTSLRKERLADGRWSGSIAKIKELTEQQRVLNSTIHDLRAQLNAKTCDRCSINETYRDALQRDFYDMQQQNIRFIAELTAERNSLREENKRLAAKLKVKEQQCESSSFNSEEDFVPSTQAPVPSFLGKMAIQRAYVPRSVKLVLDSSTEKPRAGGEKEPQQSSQCPIPFCSHDVFEVPETSFEMPSSHDSKPPMESGANLKSAAGLSLISMLRPQRGTGLQEAADSQEDKLGQPVRKAISTQKEFTQRRMFSRKSDTRMNFSWSLSSISGAENPPTQIVSETSEENMPVSTRGAFLSFTERKEEPSSSASSFDSPAKGGGKRKSKGSAAQQGTGFSVKDSSKRTPSTRQSAAKKHTNEAPSAGTGDAKAQSDTQSVTQGSGIKRKAKPQSKKGRK